MHSNHLGSAFGFAPVHLNSPQSQLGLRPTLLSPTHSFAVLLVAPLTTAYGEIQTDSIVLRQTVVNEFLNINGPLGKHGVFGSPGNFGLLLCFP